MALDFPIALAMFLTEAELKELTGKVRPSAQAKALTAMSIDHKRRPDGTVAVLRAGVERALGGQAGAKVASGWEPNWDAVNA